MKDSVKAAGGFVIFLVVAVVLIFLSALLIRGMVWVSAKATPWLILASQITFVISILALLPMCIFQKTRPWGAMGLYFASYVFGITLWAFSCIVCVDLWGYFALFVGLVMAGIGVLPVAIIAALFTASWPILGSLLLWTIATFGARALGLHIISRVDAERKAMAYAAGEDF